MNAPIRVVRFWTVYKTGLDGAPHPVDMIEYGPAGGLQLRTNIATVSSLSKLKPLAENSEDEATKMAHARWETIQPLYRKWKDGEALPEQGTPFAAWTGVSEGQISVLKAAGLATVEDLANASDGVIGTIRLPNIRALRDTAQKFLASFDKQATAQRLAAAEQENTAIKEQMEELRQIILEMQREAEKPKRGRKAAAAELEEEVAA